MTIRPPHKPPASPTRKPKRMKSAFKEPSMETGEKRKTVYRGRQRSAVRRR